MLVYGSSFMAVICIRRLSKDVPMAHVFIARHLSSRLPYRSYLSVPVNLVAFMQHSETLGQVLNTER
jgi:hypothetical protein